MSQGPFGNCKTDQLHLIDEIQSYGAMMVIDKRSNLIVAASENIHKFTGKQLESILGQPWSLILTPNLVGSMFIADPTEAANGVVQSTIIGEQALEVINHTNDNYCIVELEPGKDHIQALDFSQRCSFIKALAKTDIPQESAELLMEKVAAIIGFDRVLLYKFLPDWHGEVIAEKLKPGVEGFLGLRFPEGDVPANARRLFTVNLQRLIADVNQTTTKVITHDPTVQLDMTFAQLRAIHPVHIKYLQNLGVPASFSLSIVCDGKLWGLMACHHLSPKVLTISERQSCEELTRITAMHMSNLIAGEKEKARYQYRVSISEIRGALIAQTQGKQALSARISKIKSTFNANGVWQHIDGDDFFSGNVPDKTSLIQLKNWLAQLDRQKISYRFQIPPSLANNPALVKFASGLIYLPLNPKDFIVIFRQEMIENVNWAGKPQSIDNEAGSVAALTPRSSFQKWSQQVTGQCEPWQDVDIEAAEKLQEELIDYLERSNIEYMALRDNLTGLANRLSFERKMEASIRQSIEENSMFAVFMIDLDNFKPVNDTMGHAAGDELLIQVSDRLQSLVRDNDMVARLGGDEFAIILSNVTGTEHIDLIANRVLAEMKRTFEIGTSNVQIGASIGVSLCPIDAASQEELLHEADLALYDVKKAGRNGFKRFESAMLEGQEASMLIKKQLDDAFELNQFEFYFQPIIHAKSGKLESFEAFCVWQHPEKGALPAREFKDLIETHQLANKWAEWGLEALFKQYHQWQGAGYGVVPIAFNLSPKQFLNFDICGLCEKYAKQFDVDTTWLRIDLDEQTLAMNSRRSKEKVSQLHEYGILVNIDHFGQGMVSLTLLTNLKLNHLKINCERFHFDEATHEGNAQLEIFKSISSVLSLPIIATRVGDENSCKLATEKGLTLLQGNGLSKPLTLAEATDYLAQASS